MTTEELLERRYDAGVSVINCMAHYGMPILDRPRDCELCATDVRNTLSSAIRMNEWLNEWKEDAEALLRAQVTQ